MSSLRSFRTAFAWISMLSTACGARSELGFGEGGSGGASSNTSTTGVTSGKTSGSVAASSTYASTGTSSSNTGPACMEGATIPCGSNVGECKQGVQTCHNGALGSCMGGIGPMPETCNGKDSNCNGIINECEVGTCSPTLLMTGSTPSLPTCIDFPIHTGSVGQISFPCPQGPVMANLGGVPMTGNVANDLATMDGTAIIPASQSPDGCMWRTSHHIQGNLVTKMLSYSYSEMLIGKPPGVTCWQPCTETGTVQVNYPTGG